MKPLMMLTVAALAAGLAGCGSETASFMVDGGDRALTLERIKDYPWSEWELDVILRNDPDCQRRHTLKPTGSDGLKVDLYTPAPYVFILRQGKRWYVADMKSCQLQQFKEQPPEPGTPVGSFDAKDGPLKFVPEGQAVAGDKTAG
jgi:hypothetical protein